MNKILRVVFRPILNLFEKGAEPYDYKPLNRKILLVMGLLFFGLATAVAYVSPHGDGFGFLIPLCVFSMVGFVCIIVGVLGNDRAVAKIWGNR